MRNTSQLVLKIVSLKAAMKTCDMKLSCITSWAMLQSWPEQSNAGESFCNGTIRKVKEEVTEQNGKLNWEDRRLVELLHDCVQCWALV